MKGFTEMALDNDYSAEDLEIKISEAKAKAFDHPSIVDNSSDTPVVLPTKNVTDNRPAEVKIAALFESMAGRRDVLLAILTTAKDCAAEEDVVCAVDAAQEYNKSVFAAITLCRQLESAGALVHLNEQGEPFSEEDFEPEVVVEDDVEYIQAAEPPASFWKTTDAGLQYLESYNPFAATLSLFVANEKYTPIYKYLLKACQGEGCAVKQLASVVDNHELSQEPRYFVAHYIAELEKAGALVWAGAWVTTEVGQEALSHLSEVESI
jgi:hypothetical protein